MKKIYVNKFNGLDEIDKFLERLKLPNWLKKKWKTWIALSLLKKLNSQNSIHKITPGPCGFTHKSYYTLGKSKTNSTQLFSENRGRGNAS